MSDDTGRIAMYEYRTVGSDPAPQELMRYVYSNNLSSAMLELDDSGQIISYEEYHPFGTTAYQATNASINAVAKRYRYTGKERDEESGLYYHGARYYIPWLCRWSQCDPIGIKDGLNVYAYVSNNPVMLSDPKGTQAQGREEKPEGGNDKLVVPAIDTSTNSSGSTDLITPISTSQSYNYSGGGNQLTISTNLQTCATSIGLVANPATFSAFSSAMRADMASNPSAYATIITLGAEEVVLGDLISAALASAAASIEAGLGSLVEGLTMTLSAAAFLTISLVFIPNTANAPGSQHPPLAYSPGAIALPPGYLDLPPQTRARDNVGNPPVPPIAIPIDVAVPKEEEKKYELFYRAMSTEEYSKTGGRLQHQTDSEGNIFGEGPYVTDRLSYAMRALNNFDKANEYDLIVAYLMPAGTKEYLKNISLKSTGTSDLDAASKGLPIKKRELGDYNFKFPGNTGDMHFNNRIIFMSPIYYK